MKIVASVNVVIVDQSYWSLSSGTSVSGLEIVQVSSNLGGVKFGHRFGCLFSRGTTLDGITLFIYTANEKPIKTPEKLNFLGSFSFYSIFLKKCQTSGIFRVLQSTSAIFRVPLTFLCIFSQSVTQLS
jgi:hypothetical protein